MPRVHLNTVLKSGESTEMPQCFANSAFWIRTVSRCARQAPPAAFFAVTFAPPPHHWLTSMSSTYLSRHYIANQEEHHRVKSFRGELVEMLNNAGVEYDPICLST
jgi:hypothetical protein